MVTVGPKFFLGGAAALLAALSTDAGASPPPTPPSYVMDVARLLTGTEDASTNARFSSFVADDVQAYVNGQKVANGKADWTRYSASARLSPGRVLAYSAGWEANGSLLIADQYDAVDRANLPPKFIADPRPVSRATLYQFGPDHKVHVIRVIMGGQFWIKSNG